MLKEKKWYAVYTNPRSEKKVAEFLLKKGIENYCPLNKVQKQWSDRKKIIHEPLFKSYVFVRTLPEEHIAVRQTNGVINFVYWLNKPAIIRNEEIENIKCFLNDYSNVKLEKVIVSVNDRIRIIAGPLMELEGQVISVNNKTVTLKLPSLGYWMHAEVASSNIKVIPESTSPQNKLVVG